MENTRMIRLLAAAVLLGGLRDPRLAALGEVAVFAFLWKCRPPLGPARIWMPWLLWAFLSAALSLQPLAALPPLARWFAVLAFFSLAAQWDKGDRDRWLKTLLAVSAALGAAAFWTGARFGFRATMTGLLPPYYNYTTFALSAGVAAGATWACHPRAVAGRWRYGALVVAMFGGICLLLAHGRGAFLGMFVAAIAWSARRWGIKGGLGALVAAGLAGAAFKAPLRAYLAHHGGMYRDVRLEIWERAIAIANEKPWLGVGPGSFGAAFRLRPVEARGGQARWGMNSDFAHSEPFQAAAESGWIGLMLWLVGMGASLSFLFRRASDEPAREAAAVAAIAMGAHLLVDNMLQIPGLAMLFFSALAVAGAGVSGRARWPRAAAVLGGALALVSWMPRTYADRDPEIAANIYPREAYPREDLAYRAMRAGDFAQADTLWAQAEERAPFNAIFLWRRAQIAASQGRWDAVEAFARQGAQAEPEFLNLRVLRAQALLRLGRRQEARDELSAVKKALSVRSDQAGSSQYDATVWDFDSKEFDRTSAAARAMR